MGSARGRDRTDYRRWPLAGALARADCRRYSGCSAGRRCARSTIALRHRRNRHRIRPVVTKSLRPAPDERVACTSRESQCRVEGDGSIVNMIRSCRAIRLLDPGAMPPSCESRVRGAVWRLKSIPIRAPARSILISARSRRSARPRAISPAAARARPVSRTALTTAILSGRRLCGSSFVESKGLRDAAIAFDTPVISGNVSFYNETEGRAIPPTPTIAMVGLFDDVGYILSNTLSRRRSRFGWCARRIRHSPRANMQLFSAVGHEAGAD